MTPRHRRLVLALAIIPALIACGGSSSSTAGETTDVAVAVSEAGCAPVTVEAPAGQVRFVVTNAGTDTGEFEIIDADQRVVDEAENIVPGFVVNLSTRLDGGAYELVCGTLSAPRGTLTVSGGAAAPPPANTVVDAVVLAETVATYKTWVLGQADDLVAVIDTFTEAVDSGDLAAAKVAYGPARVPWERIEPIAELFADIDPKVDAREDDFEAGVDDPAFTGYHRIEKALWIDDTTDGLGELTTTLRSDMAELRRRLDTLEIEPRVMARGAGELIDEVAQSKMTGEEDRYSKLDLWSIQPNVEGSAKIVDLLRPIIAGVDADYLAGLDASYDVVEAIIAKYGDQATGFKTFDQIDPADLKALQAGLADLSERLAQLPGRLGLEA